MTNKPFPRMIVGRYAPFSFIWRISIIFGLILLLPLTPPLMGWGYEDFVEFNRYGRGWLAVMALCWVPMIFIFLSLGGKAIISRGTAIYIQNGFVVFVAPFNYKVELSKLISFEIFPKSIRVNTSKSSRLVDLSVLRESPDEIVAIIQSQMP